jgi:alcohol dehydrogenase class IV
MADIWRRLTGIGEKGKGATVMIQAFEFFSVGQVIFGCDGSQQLGPLAKRLGTRALLVTNAGTPGDGRLVDQTIEGLAKAGVVASCYRQRGEPRVEDVEAALGLARGRHCDVVIALGGGSAIDAGKAVAGLLTNGGAVLDYMEVIGRGQKLTCPSAPWIAVPTTAGTGAEVTRNAVIGCPEKQFKASLRSELLLPRIALVDPVLALGVRREVTASSGMDALCQLIESFTSNRAQPLTDGLALHGIELAAQALPRVVAAGDDLDSRGKMAVAALISGITLTNVGLGAVHGFAAPAGARYPIPHGVVCARLLPPVIQANVAALRAGSSDDPCLAKYAQIGRALTGTRDPGHVAIQAGIRFLYDLLEELQIPPLRQFGLTPDGFPELIAAARQASSMRYNPVTLSDEALQEILHQAW